MALLHHPRDSIVTGGGGTRHEGVEEVKLEGGVRVKEDSGQTDAHPLFDPASLEDKFDTRVCHARSTAAARDRAASRFLPE